MSDKVLPYTLSIDPGFGSGTGWALWENKDWKKCYPPIDFGVLKASGQGNEWVNRCLILGDAVSFIMQRGVASVYCEFPALFNSAGSHMATAQGDIFKLAFLVGVYANVAHQYRASFYPVEVAAWKGQMGKDVVAERIGKRLHEEPWSYPSHSNDAVGIGLYAKGFFSPDRSTRVK